MHTNAGWLRTKTPNADQASMREGIRVDGQRRGLLGCTGILCAETGWMVVAPNIANAGVMAKKESATRSTTSSAMEAITLYFGTTRIGKLFVATAMQSKPRVR